MYRMFCTLSTMWVGTFQVGHLYKNLPANTEDTFDPWVGRLPGIGNGTHSRILEWRIPQAEEPGRLEPMGLQRVRHNSMHTLSYVSDVPRKMLEFGEI